MAINIKEILTTDSDIIKVDKTNYNFDQIIANGGGPIGIKGQKGELGGIGNTGVKGEKGDIGPKGDTGASGADVNNWGRISYDSATDADILKPKRDSSSDEPASIILGDAGYEDGVTDGIVNPTAWLNIVLPDSAKYSNYASFLNSTSSVLNLTSSTQSNVDTYQINHGTSTNDVDFKIDIKNSLYLNAPDLVQITSETAIKLNAADGDITLGPDSPSVSLGQIDLRADSVIARGNLIVEGTTAGYIKVPNGTTTNRPTGEYGMIRYNTDLDVGHSSNEGSLETFVPHPDGDYWKPLGNMVDADGDTFITVDYDNNDGTDNVIRLNIGYDEDPTDGNVTFITEVVGSFGETVSDGTTDIDRVFKYNNVIYAADDILVANDYGLRIKENNLTPGSGQVAAQNSSTVGATAANRTLVDYFYRESALQYNVIDLTVQPINGIDDINLNTNYYSNDILIGHAKSVDPLAGPPYPRINIGIIISNSTKMSYIKIGHMVTVWGRIDMFAKPVDSNILETGDINLAGTNSSGSGELGDSGRRVGFKIGGVEHFPYTSALTKERVIFPIAINPNNATDEQNPDLNKRYFGVIFPGMNVFNILEVDNTDGMIPGTFNEDSSQPEGRYLDMEDLITDSDTYPIITIDYNFSMPVDENSYELGNNDYVTYTEISAKS